MDAATAARFWAKVDKAGPVPAHRPDLGPCWLWTAATTGSDGEYGYFRLDGRMRPAHLVAWESECGSVPEGLELDHLCRVRICVRPPHLEPVEHIVNARRGAASIRLAGVCASGRHPITGEADLVIRGGRTRGCAECTRERQREADRRRSPRDRKRSV
jgi:hypothetical protein